MATHVMSDIETLGLTGDCVILAIGGVKFDQNQIIGKFHVGIDPVDAQRYGLKVDAATAWNYWCSPKRDEARAKLYEMPKIDLYSALSGFADWCNLTDPSERGSLWGKGATFDNVRIKSAFDTVGLEYPFTYRQDECYRTMANRCPEIPYVQHGIAHDALDDAMSQALHLQAICKDVGIVL